MLERNGESPQHCLALGRLQAQGHIRRIPLNGRLDQQRYAYARWSPSPLEKSRLTSDQAYTELARRYFRWIAPAKLKEFQWFSGLGVKASKQVVEPLGLIPIETGSDFLIFPGELDAFHASRVEKQPSYALVTSLDGLLLLRRDLAGFLDQTDEKRKVVVDKTKKELGGLQDLPHHAILDRGRLIGLWEFDPSSKSIAWTSFSTADKQLKSAVSKTEEFIREQLGDARSFSLDSPKSRAPRIAALR